MTAQAYEPNGQALPAWESWEAYVTTLNGVPKTTERVVELPLTSGWVGVWQLEDRVVARQLELFRATLIAPVCVIRNHLSGARRAFKHYRACVPLEWRPQDTGGTKQRGGVIDATTAWSISASAAAASSDAPGSSSSTPSGLSNLASFLVALLVPLSLLLVLGLFLFALFRRRRSYAAVATALTAPDQSEKPAPVTDPSATDPPAPAHDERTSLLAPDGAGADAELAALVLASQRLLERLGVSRPSSRQSRPSRPASRLVSGNTLEKGYGDRLGPPAHARSRSAGTAATDDDVPARPASTPHTLNHVPDNELFYRAPPLSPGSTARGLGLGLGESRPVSGLALVSSDAPRHLRAGIYQRDPVRALGSALSSSSRGSHRSRSSGGSGSASSAGSRPSTRAAWARAQSPIPETPAFSLRVLDTPSSHGQHFGELGEGEGEVDVGEFGARRQCPDGERMRFPKPPATPVQPAPGAPSMERSVSGADDCFRPARSALSLSLSPPTPTPTPVRPPELDVALSPSGPRAMVLPFASPLQSPLTPTPRGGLLLSPFGAAAELPSAATLVPPLDIDSLRGSVHPGSSMEQAGTPGRAAAGQ
ncbi:hypothetical protein Q5752_005821 [Cryptotrichosporon argae]